MPHAHTLIASFAFPVVLAAATPVLAQRQFEGSVTLKTSMEGKSFESTLYSKGQRVRQEIAMGGQSAVTITDYGTGKSITLMPGQKKYMVMDFKAMAEAMRPMAEALKPDRTKKPDAVMPKIVATGRKEKILGHPCEHYTAAADDGMVMDFCVAKGMGTFNGARGGAGAGGGSAAASDPRFRELVTLFKDGFFPLRTTMSKGGKTLMESEVVKVEAKSLANDLFVPPSDYTEVKIPSLPGKRP
jgi:Domain of unknown function (DUF4412)